MTRQKFLQFLTICLVVGGFLLQQFNFAIRLLSGLSLNTLMFSQESVISLLRTVTSPDVLFVMVTFNFGSGFFESFNFENQLTV